MIATARAAALAAAAALLACGEGGVRPNTTLTAADSADQVLEGFATYVTSDGVRRSRIEADTAFYYEAAQTAQLRRVRTTFYDPKGAESSRLTADRGTYHAQDGNMEAEGHVVVTAQDGRRLETEALKFDNKANKISTDRTFRFQRGDEHIEGNSFNSDPDFKNVVTDRPRGVAGKGMLLPGQQ
ncbi:MAG TPA: LPS export ABC transporter periplasmic protein LptC [Gemmatimonadales bacterium]|nr:LPS export ABC transporter periplasmic protein LptC [Gemmatimonadales bacterium]